MASMLEACRANQGLPAKLTAGSRVGYDLSKVGAGASRGFNGKKKLEAVPWSNTWPAPGATLDLDFANNRGFVRGLGQGGVMDGITFTRASNATYVGEDGLLKGWTRESRNLISSPQDFSTNVWTRDNVTVSTNATRAPDNTTTGNAIYETGASSFHGVRLNVGVPTSVGITYTGSIRAKANGRNYLLLYANQNSVGKYFDITPGTAGAVLGNYSANAATGSITPLGDDWFLCTLTFVTTSTSINFETYISDNGARVSFAGDTTKGIYIWGAQLELGSTATEYFPTNINVPRFDWASTATVAQRNLVLNTDAADSAVNGTLVAAASVTDSVTIPMQEFSIGAAALPTATVAVKDWGTQAGLLVSRTLSFYVQPLLNRYIYFSTNTNGSQSNVGRKHRYDTTDGTLTTLFNAHNESTAKVINLGNGLYRCVVTIRQTTNSGSKWFGAFCSDTSETVGGSNAYITPSSAPNGNFRVGGWQCEDAGDVSINPDPSTYISVGAQVPATTPLVPAPTCNGLLIEEARTNRLLWCRDATQSNWVKTDITAAKDQIGIDGVANAASSLTATADGGTCIQTITLSSGSRTGSVYLKRLSGAGTVQVSLDSTTWSTVELSNTEWRRIALSGTVTNPVVGIRLATSGDVVAMDFGQIEDGASVTTPILTTAAATTRSVDSVSIAASPTWFSQAAVTIKADFINKASPSTSNYIWTVNGADLRFQGGYSISGAAAVSGNAPGLLNRAATSGLRRGYIANSLNGNQTSELSIYGFPLTSEAQITSFLLGFVSSTSTNLTFSRFVFWDKASNPKQLQELSR